MSGRELKGAMTALVTPFDAAGQVDETTFRRLVRRQLGAGIHGLVPCGTTGETPTLSVGEWTALVAIAVEEAGGRVPVIAGTGSNDTAASVRRTQKARELGADAALVVVPYYNKPNASGLRAHFRTVAEEGGLPVVLYNVPGRTGRRLSVEDLLDLAEIPGVVAVKEASGEVELTARLLCQRPPGLSVLSGDDALTLPIMALGGEGVISVAGNEDPGRMSRLCDAMLRGDLARARGLHAELMPLMEANFLESNPVPVKEALGLMCLMQPVFRPPLGPAAPATRTRLRDVLGNLGLLEAHP